MKIVNILESTHSIKSDIRNAYIDFSKMTLSLVAVVTDVIRDGRPVIGYGFNSNGRYGQGALMRDRFIPRVLEADPAGLLHDSGERLDPHKIWARMMINEKHGGHQMSLAIATGLGLGLGGNEIYPDLFQPCGGFPDGVKVDNGHVTLPPCRALASRARAT